MDDADHSGTKATSFARDGVERIRSVLKPSALRSLANLTSALPQDRAGVRLRGIVPLRPFLDGGGPIGEVAASVLGDDARPVRAILFDKTPARNWALGWHQDRTIVVSERVEVDGFGPWTVKGGLLHVAPPYEVLAGMVTLRIHLDPVSETNAPLLVAPGSHRLGRIAEARIPETVRRCGTFACLADAGDVWLYSTPILHASEAAQEPVHRRVLQIDFTATDLPGELTWLGV